MTVDLFNEITDSRSSWAFWPLDFDVNYKKYFEDNFSKLKPNVIFLGLNLSGIVGDGENFHKPENRGVKLLKAQISVLKNISGGFMTDLYSNISKSSKIKTNHVDIDCFITKLEQLGEDKIMIICFGNTVYNDLKAKLLKDCISCTVEKNSPEIKLLEFSTTFKNIELCVYRVWHYSNYGKFQTKLTELKGQLRYINDQKGPELINHYHRQRSKVACKAVEEMKKHPLTLEQVKAQANTVMSWVGEKKH